MVSDFFGTLLQEVARKLQIPNLQPDKNNSCQIRFGKDLRIQLEIDPSGQNLIIGTNLGTVPPGRYRENIFTEALKANNLPSANRGTFAYSRKTDSLILFEKMPLKDLTGDIVADFLVFFLEKAKIWKEAVTRGEVPVAAAGTVARPTGMFGLR